MRSLRSREGYLLIDNRHAPGPGGVAFVEAAVRTCAHCQKQLIRNPLRTRERARCFSCDYFICDLCALILKIKGVCVPFAKVLDDLEASILRQRIF